MTFARGPFPLPEGSDEVIFDGAGGRAFMRTPSLRVMTTDFERVARTALRYEARLKRGDFSVVRTIQLGSLTPSM